MSIILELKNPDLLPALLRAANEDLLKKKEDFIKAKKELSEAEELVLLISSVNNSRNSNIPNGYDQNWSYGKKAEFVLSLLGTSTTGKIADEIMKYEPNEDRKKVVKNLSVAFSTQRDKFKRIDKGDYNEYSL
jgi:hypothetical protein